MHLKQNNNSKLPLGQNMNPLVQPLINISKVSTPIRTRVVGAPQANSTPLNFKKNFIQNNLYSPSINKQNNNCNHTLKESAMRKFKSREKSQTNINLSPIMALNRKINEGPRVGLTQSRSMNSHNFSNKKSEFCTNFAEQMGDKNYQILQSPKIATKSYMRISNSFKSLLSSGSKSPTRLGSMAFAQLNKNSQFSSETNLKSSIRGSNNFFQGLVQKKQKENKYLSTCNTSKDLMCVNKHNKKAKYKLVTENTNQISVYCSKCAINLVQQGLVVEDLFQQNQSIENTQNFHIIENIKNNLEFCLQKIDTSRLQCLDNFNDNFSIIQNYYNKIIEYVNQKKKKDLEKINNARQKILQLPQWYKQRIQNQLMKIKQKQYLNAQNYKQIQTLLQKPIQYPQKSQIGLIQSNVNSNYQKFQILFDRQIQLKYRNTQQYNNKTSQQNFQSSNTGSFRFSFQKALNKQKNRMLPSDMNPLMQEQQDDDDNEEEMNEKQAFRTLFPNDNQQESNQLEETSEQTIHSPTFKQF